MIRSADTAVEVERKISLALAAGDWAPGERIPEARVARELKVSRTPVREAVRLLAAAGVLELAPNEAPRVRRMDAEELALLYDLRIELEGYVCERAAAVATPTQKRRLQNAAEGFGRLLHSLPPEATLDAAVMRRLFRVEQRFHGALNRAARNPWLEQMLRQTNLLSAVYLRVASLHPRDSAHDALQRSYERHRNLADLIAAGKGADARKSNTRYLRETRERELRRAKQRLMEDKE
jgi:DNA-binding GntR family transcriptional regulator